MKSNPHKFYERALATALLLLCLFTAFFVASKYILDLAVSSCFETLRRSTRAVASDISGRMQAQREKLDAAARLLAETEDLRSQEAARVLAAFSSGGTSTRLELLLPDGTVLQEDGRSVPRFRAPEAQALLSQGARIAPLETEDGGKVLRSYLPVQKNGSTAALLCAVIEPDALLALCPHLPFEGSSELFVLEAHSGNFLVDTWRGSLGNVSGLAERRMKPGYRMEDLRRGIKSMESGQTAFLAETDGKPLYCDYEPAGTADWMVMLTVREDAAFRDAQRVGRMLVLLAAVDLLILLGYLAWAVSRFRREAQRKETQLGLARAMLEIERLLFGAHREPERVQKALEKTAQMAGAEHAFLLSLEGNTVDRAFLCSGALPEDWTAREGMDPAKRFPLLSKALKKTGALVLQSLASLEKESPEEAAFLERLGIHSLMLAPVKNSGGLLTGVLGAANLSRGHKSTEPLEIVSFSFAQALNNMRSFEAIRKQGEQDHLTGLPNRSSFQRAMEAHEKDGDLSLSCVYVDADGLHEVNNRLGHAAGDRMLQSVACALREEFGGEDTYRIGGDEFVAFCRLSPSCLREKVDRIAERLAAENCHISVGIETRRDTPLISEMVKQAEKKMYEAKREYYQGQDRLDQVRDINRELEHMLSEKRDLEAFRSVVASKYRGMYIVDMSLDALRSIYIPPYFERILRSTGGKFSLALRLYAEEYVAPEYRNRLLALLDFPGLEARLGREKEWKLVYRRKDGARILLRVCLSPDYSPQVRECIWSFEIVPDTKPLNP